MGGLCYSLGENRSVVLGEDEGGWSERAGMGGGAMGSLDNIGSKWAPHTPPIISLSLPLCFVILYSFLSRYISAQGFMFFLSL